MHAQIIMHLTELIELTNQLPVFVKIEEVDGAMAITSDETVSSCVKRKMHEADFAGHVTR